MVSIRPKKPAPPPTGSGAERSTWNTILLGRHDLQSQTSSQAIQLGSGKLEELTGLAEAFEVVDSCGFERERRTSKQKLCCRGDEDLACRRCTRHACGFVNCKAANVRANGFNLAGVNSGADGDAEVGDR